MDLTDWTLLLGFNRKTQTSLGRSIEQIDAEAQETDRQAVTIVNFWVLKNDDINYTNT